MTEVRKAPRVSNPLSMIAYFAGTSEVTATIVLPFLNDNAEVQATFIWFVMLFPILLVLLFFATLIFRTKVLYAPSDYQDEANFVNLLHGGAIETGQYVEENSNSLKLKAFWKTDGKINKKNSAALRKWMTENNIDKTVTVTEFLNAQRYQAERAKAVTDLKL